jgi:hypothetical protein
VDQRLHERQSLASRRPSARFVRVPPRVVISTRRKLALLVLVNLASFAILLVLGEVGFRLLWNPKYWIRCDRWVVGAGQTEAGRKWWPETTYLLESAEFRTEFRTDARGYRARPEPARTERPYRVAFVGDSFTEGMQVDHDKTFCALLERGLAHGSSGREVICENYGVAGTGLFDYWHRIAHDVLTPRAPDALVLCLYPGNDFTAEFPDDGFEADGRPRRAYFREPGWGKHVLTWLNLKSKLSHYVQRSLLMASLRWNPRPIQGPLRWWADPAVAATAPDAPAVRRSRALLKAIDEACRQHGTRLCLLVVGPALPYAAKDGQSPIARLVADWGLAIPVIDAAVEAVATPGDGRHLVFPRDGHLNEIGHAFIASTALPSLQAALAPAGSSR